jgi:hypothetical protein
MAMLMSGGGGGTRFNKRHRPARHAEDTAEKRADRKIENEIIDMLAVDNMGTQLLTQVPDLKRFIVELQKALLAITDHHSLKEWKSQSLRAGASGLDFGTSHYGMCK